MKKLIYHIVSFLWAPLIVVFPIATMFECDGIADDLQHFYWLIGEEHKVSEMPVLSTFGLWSFASLSLLGFCEKIKDITISRIIGSSLLIFVSAILWLCSPDIGFLFGERSGFSLEQKYYAKTLMVLLPYYIVHAFSISFSIFVCLVTIYRYNLKSKEGDMEKWERMLLNVPL